MKIEDVVIIGAGPAGIAAAIQLKRSGLDPLVLEKSRIGGLLANANLVENYPGFPSGITGLDLVKLFDSHIRNTGVRVVFEEVVALDFDGRFVLATPGQKLLSKVVVVASGTAPKPFDTFEIPPDAAPKTFYEAVPLRGAENQHIAVVGAGDAAFDYALNLSRNNHVIVLNRGDKIRCLPLLWERARKAPRIEYVEKVSLRGMEVSGSRLALACSAAQKTWELVVDYVIFATGRAPRLDFLSSQLEETVTDLEKDGLLYFIGDVTRGDFRQTSIAAGDGIKAAMRIYQKLRGSI